VNVNALSIDLEFWWCNEFLTDYLPRDREDGFRESLRPVFAVLDAFDVKATFFVLGAVAEKYPEVVSEIHRSGHEIACHAYSHKPLYTMNRSEFEGELRKSLELLDDYNPVGFRAPSFSLSNETKWAIEVLEKYGFQYDSSIFPVRTQLYGVPDAPVGIYRPSRDDITVHDPDGPIVEFPLSVIRLGTNIPVSGGFYLRALPKRFLSWGVGRVATRRPANIYVHPHDIYPGPPLLKVPFISRLVTYHGVRTSLEKLIMLMARFSFMPMGALLDGMALLPTDAPVPAAPAAPLRAVGRDDPTLPPFSAPGLRRHPLDAVAHRHTGRTRKQVCETGDPDEVW
jgi:polysaccharide deacetylase family protein (PEP-CTERM system associated)